MQLIIKKVHYPNSGYKWKLYDGPDGVEYFEGFENSFDEVISEVHKVRKLIGTYYA